MTELQHQRRSIPNIGERTQSCVRFPISGTTKRLSMKTSKCFCTFIGATVISISAVALMITSVAADDLTRPIRASPDGHFLVRPGGEPFFWLGDWAWELFKNPNRDEVDRYLKDRSQKGFNIILAPVTGDFNALTRPNRYGYVPFVNDDPTRPDPHYFENVDWIVKRAVHYGLRMALMPSWGEAVVGGWDGGPSAITGDNAQIYGRWLAARYRGQGIVWVLGGDRNPMWPKSLRFDSTGKLDRNNERTDMAIVDYRSVYDALAKGILEGNGGSAFITYHPTGGNWPGTPQARTSLCFGDRAWLSMNMIQSGHGLNSAYMAQALGLEAAWNASFNYEPVNDEYQSKPTRPIIDGEPRFEDLAINLNPDNGYWKAYDVRNAAYNSLFAGAAGLNYGDESAGLFYDPARGPRLEIEMRPWQQALSAPGSRQMQLAKALMLSRPYFTRIPDQSIIVGDQGRGEPHIGATRDRQGSYAMIYLPHGQQVMVDLSKISGTHAVAWWFDPRTGVSTHIEGRFPTSGTKSFSPPTSGADTDWVLVLDDDKQEFVNPGQTRQ